MLFRINCPWADGYNQSTLGQLIPKHPSNVITIVLIGILVLIFKCILAPLLDSCSVAKRATTDYNDIVNYVHKWTKNYKRSNQLLNETKQFVRQAVNSSGNVVEQILQSHDFSIEDENNIVNYIGKTETGTMQ